MQKPNKFLESEANSPQQRVEIFENLNILMLTSLEGKNVKVKKAILVDISLSLSIMSN